MKRFVLLLVVLLVPAVFARADTYIKQHAHTDAYYYGGITSPARDSENELWIGDGKMMYCTEMTLIIVDQTRNVLIFANKHDSTYAETPLPLEWPNLVPEDVAGMLKMYESEGTVEDAGETKEILGYACRAYKINMYIPYEGQKYNEQDIMLWVTSDIPEAVKTMSALSYDVFKLRNYKEEFAKELMKIEGIQMLEETTTYTQGMSYQSMEETVEVSEKIPPYDVYSAPQGFKKKDKLSLQDLEND